jgi:hypothetical protein
MTFRFARAAAVAGALLTLAAPGVAAAHGRHGLRPAVRCAAVEAGYVPHGASADQASALKAACDTYAAAVKAADDAFATTAQPAADAVKSVRDQLRTAKQARRSACAADRTAQACTDARSAVATLRGQLRQAWQAYRAAVKPARRTRDAAARAAAQALRAQIRQILG